MTRLVVLDASALLTLILDPSERGERVAEAVMGNDLHAPDLLPYEIGNVLRRRELAGQLTSTEATLAREAASRLPVQLWPFAAVSTRVWDLRQTLTSYDAAYAALAERLSASLLTCDARLAHAPGPTCTIDLIR